MEPEYRELARRSGAAELLGYFLLDLGDWHYDKEKYQELSAFDNLVPERSPVAGQYNPQLRIIYAAQGDHPMPISARIVAHEATHHFAQLRLARSDSYLPIWLNEGIAEFVESMKMANRAKSGWTPSTAAPSRSRRDSHPGRR
jgi:hypothetical protein